jgi:hypothetical protein
MTEFNGLRYFEVEFAADGSLQRDGGLPGAVAGGGIEDLFVFSHGWNNSAGSARDMYADMFGQLAGLLGDRLGSSAAVGVFWPSLLFPEDDPTSGSQTASSGATLAEALAPAFPDQQDDLHQLGKLLDTQPQDPAELERFHSLAKGLVTTPTLAAEDSGESGALDANTASVFGHAASMSKLPVNAAQGVGNPFTMLWHGGREVLRTLSYYEMKNRAGVVGKQGLGPLIGSLSPVPRVHLMGHSFGARLVSFALTGLGTVDRTDASPVKSLFLVQGAFSHFAFADPMPIDHGRSGVLADFAGLIDGPMLATFTSHDRAVGWWYPSASMLKHEDSQAADDLMYRWGAMGHDGFQMEGTVTMPLGPAHQAYGFEAGRRYLLDSNAIICTNQSAFSGAHSDIRHPEVLWALASAAGVS